MSNIFNPYSWYERYTKTGTVKILPPPPIKPREIPIKIEAK
mgnify:CR=1 FL=1